MTIDDSRSQFNPAQPFGPSPHGRAFTWFLATRPSSLPGAAIPVVVALALAHCDLASGRVATEAGRLLWIPAICCLAFAMLAQLAANLINDYADFKTGADNVNSNRLPSALVAGWIEPRAALIATFLILAAACSFGLALLPYGGWPLLVAGVASCVFCLAYSAGPFPFAYNGLGDVLVVVFFGFVPTTFTYYLQTGEISLESSLIGLAIGFATDNMLVANNYRDRDEDREHRKFTLVALWGERFGRYFYLANGLAVFALLAAAFLPSGAFIPLAAAGIYLILHWRAWRKLAALRSGTALNAVYDASIKNVAALGVLLTIALLAQ
ncbi:MAG: prenyltransferase [Thermoguttaceae bacterium]|nr:prenyltransferase [Thermoguttaceae bacterium]